MPRSPATLLIAVLALFPILGAGTEPVPTGSFFNGVFPSIPPGTSTGFTSINAFPNLRFIGPVWLTDYPGTNDLVVTSKAGHIWRFDNNPNVMPGDVTVMLNFSKYAGSGVDLPANVLPDATNLPTVVATEKVVSSVSFAIFNISFHPQFGTPGHPHEDHVFVSYMPRPVGIPVTENLNYFRVSQFTIIDDPSDGPIIDPSSELILINQFNADRNHEGGAMFFGSDGFLWLTHGDGGFGDGYETAANTPSQRLDGTLKGGILRIDVDMQGGAISHPIRRQPDDLAMDPSVRPPAGWPASSTGNYYIPSDNPWVDPSPTSDILEEFWSIGLRSPHTMQQDLVTGDIWIGEVGGSAEEIHLAQPSSPGQNFGWRYINGDGTPMPNPLLGTDSPAYLTIPRSVSTSVIGGYLYRDAEFPSLQGKFLWADNIRKTVYAMDPLAPSATDLLLATLETGTIWTGPANICRGPNGEVFFPYMGGYEDSTKLEDNDGTIQRLAPANPSPDPPALLSQTGAFPDLPTLTPHPSFIPFDVNAPLWSDRAVKSRWIALPNNGSHDSPSEQISFSEKENWIFPEGTVLMKHFELPDDDTDPGSTVRLETRFVICTAGNEIYGVTYRWLPDQSDAVLINNAETGNYQIAEVGGGSRTETWSFPGRNDCLLCHNAASGQALGVRTHQLNGDYSYPDGSTANQLLVWSSRGMLDVSLTPAQVADYIQSRHIADTTAPLEHRVRSYLDSNCAHCHQPGAVGGGNFDARLATPLLGQSFINQTPGFYTGLPGGLYVDPSNVPNSIVHHRMDHALPDPAAMPPLAKNLVDAAAVQTVSDWINTLLPGDFPTTSTALRALLAGPTSTTGDLWVTITLDDDVSDLVSGDLSVSNGTILEFSGSCHYYLARIRPTGGTLTISLPASTATGDNTGVSNSISNTLVIPFTDSEPPTATFVSLPVDGTIPGTTNIGIDFGKSVTSFTLADLVITNCSAGNLSSSNGAYFFDITPTTPGPVSVSVNAGAVLDSLSRTNTTASIDLTYVPTDTDGDGLADVDEATHGSNPTNPDTDGDGLLDGDEVHTYGSNPLLSDTDSDGFLDGSEVYWNSDPDDASNTPQSEVPSSLVVYYDFDEGSGTVANDAAVSDGIQNAVQNQGTIGWTTTNQLIGAAALDLNGWSSLFANDALTPGVTTGLTICGWVNPDTNGGYKGVYMGRNSPGNWGLAVENQHSDLRFANTGGTSVGLDSANVLLANAGWFHLAITWTTTGPVAKGTAYLNGVPYGSAQGNVSLSYIAPTLGYYIGDDPCCPNRRLNGQIDDIAVFNEALSAEQIALIYHAGLAGLPLVNAFTTAPFVINAVEQTVDDDKIRLTWGSEPATTYSILTTTDPSIPHEHWTVVYNNIPSVGLSTSFTTVFATSSPLPAQRFFVVKKN